MRISSPPRVAALLVVALLLGIGSQQLFASAPTVKGKGKLFQTYHQVVSSQGGGFFFVTFTTVPDKQVLVITDVIVSNGSGSANDFKLTCLTAGGGDTEVLLPDIEVASTETWQHSFATGLECTAGQSLRFDYGTSSPGLTLTLVGYYRKGK